MTKKKKSQIGLGQIGLAQGPLDPSWRAIIMVGNVHQLPKLLRNILVYMQGRTGA